MIGAGTGAGLTERWFTGVGDATGTLTAGLFFAPLALAHGGMGLSTGVELGVSSGLAAIFGLDRPQPLGVSG